MDRMSAGLLRVAVLAGGDSAERAVSLASGARVAAALQAAGYACQTIDPARVALAAVDWDCFDGCFLALHGGAGEDGRVQRWLEERGIPYTGSGPAASHAAMSKSLSKRLLRRHGVPTPRWVLLKPSDDPARALRKVESLGFPAVIKPEGGGSSLGVGVARNADELTERVARARRYDPWTLAESYVAGRELTVAVLGRRPLPLLEVVGCEHIFDYDSKYSSTVIQYRFRTGLVPIKVKESERQAVAAAEALGTAGLARVDLMLDRQLRLWVLEVNTLPGMTDRSLAPRAAAEAGLDLSQLCDWMLRDALERAARTVPAAA